MIDGLIILVILLVLIFAGVPVALAMALSGILGYLAFGPHLPFITMLQTVGDVVWLSVYSWLLVCIVFFLLMAEFMGRSNLAEMLFSGIAKVTAGVRGSLAMATTIGCALFGLTTGSGIAEVAALGRIAIPEMTKRGYDSKLALGVVAASGALGFLVPPSIFLIIYAAWAQYSVARLFAAALIPGFIMAVFLWGATFVQVRLKPSIAAPSPTVPLKERIKGGATIWPVMLIGGTVLGLIFAGAATPVEASGVGAVLALLIVLILPKSRRFFNWSFLKDSALSAVKITGTILFIYVGAQILSGSWNIIGVPIIIARYVAGLDVNPIIVIILMYLVLLLLGCLVDAISVLVLTMPIFVPLILQLGYDPVWFGVMMGMLIGCGQITPPVGLCLYTVKAIFPQYSFMAIVRGSIPYLIAELLCIALLTVLPQLSMWLPTLMYGPTPIR
ncbi:TRAP transporter large permease [Chloroflexota bacterium]